MSHRFYYSRSPNTNRTLAADNIGRTDEMRPEWFSDGSDSTSALPPIPIKQMWADDEFWMPLFLQNKLFVGRGDFAKDNKMLRYWFGEQTL